MFSIHIKLNYTIIKFSMSVITSAMNMSLKYYRAIFHTDPTFWRSLFDKDVILELFALADGLNNQNCLECQWVNGVAVSHLLCMQKAPGSNPGLSIFAAKLMSSQMLNRNFLITLIIC